MITAYILFTWTVVAAGSSGREYRDWRPQSEFYTQASCIKAIGELGLNPKDARCISTGKL